MFNINKYKGKVFHSKSSINKKIEALFLKFDKDSYEMKLDYKGKIKLINIYIKTLVEHEEYEVAKAFRDRKFNKYKKWRNTRRKNKIPFKLRFRLLKFKISKFLRNKFKSQ